MDGQADRVVNAYLGQLSEDDLAHLGECRGRMSSGRRLGSYEAQVTDVELLDDAGSERYIYESGEPLVVRIGYRCTEPVQKPVFGIAVFRNDGWHINGPNTKFSGQVVDYIQGDGAVYYEIDSLPLLPGTYYFTAVVYNYACDRPYDHHDQLFPFQVVPGCTEEEYGVFWIPHRWRYEGDHGEIVS